MTVYTTLNKIRYYKAQGFDFRAAKRFWKTLLFSLNKKKADDEPVALISVLHSNGLGDAIWCLRTISDEHRYKIVLFAADVAERVLPLFEKQYPTDLRPRQTIQAARDFVAGKIGEKEINTFVKIFFTLDCASDRVIPAAVFSARTAAYAANTVRAANNARDAARYAVLAAGDATFGHNVPWDKKSYEAAKDAERKAQIQLFHKHFGEQS